MDNASHTYYDRSKWHLQNSCDALKKVPCLPLKLSTMWASFLKGDYHNVTNIYSNLTQTYNKISQSENKRCVDCLWIKPIIAHAKVISAEPAY